MKSVQEVSKEKNQVGSHGKTDVRYWQKAIFFPSYTGGGVKHQVPHLAVKLQHRGRRETIPLGTANRAAAAATARNFYLALRAGGWDAALSKFQIKGRRQSGVVDTVGEFITEAQANWSGKLKTLADYIRSFRKIVADTFQIKGGKEKYDYRGGGRAEWIRKIDSVKLRELTPARVQKWKVAFLHRAGSDNVRKRSAAISVNSLLRQAKSLFAPSILKFIKLESGSPFEAVSFEPRQSMKYQSRFDITKLIPQAQEELPVEQFKIFLLASMAGLRRNEIDKLPWDAFRWDKGLIRIEATAYFHPKSEDSIGDVEIDPQMVDLFRGYHARATGEFVVESSVAPRLGTGYSHYRCEELFSGLVRWLRAHGVDTATPLHTLRKEFGSQICDREGIYAASTALRHADIAITSQHYVDKKRRVTVGLGELLERPNNVISIKDEAETKTTTPADESSTQPHKRRAGKKA